MLHGHSETPKCRSLEHPDTPLCVGHVPDMVNGLDTVKTRHGLFCKFLLGTFWLEALLDFWSGKGDWSLYGPYIWVSKNQAQTSKGEASPRNISLFFQQLQSVGLIFCWNASSSLSKLSGDYWRAFHFCWGNSYCHDEDLLNKQILGIRIIKFAMWAWHKSWGVGAKDLQV